MKRRRHLTAILGFLSLIFTPPDPAEKLRQRPHVLPAMHTFMNFGSDAGWMRDKIELCFNRSAKQGQRS